MKKLLPGIIILLLLFISCGSKRIETEILWDKSGVPHIYASTNQDAYYAFGWAQMRNHADLILKLYAVARGRAAEYFGRDYIESDRQMLAFGLPDLAKAGYGKIKPEYRSYLDSFVRGMNDYGSANQGSIGEKFRNVLPVTPEDILAHTLRVINIEFLASDDITAVKRQVAPGSNSIAIAPSRSQSGKAMLVSNPHLPWKDFFLWFESHLNSPDMNVYGIALVGMPVLTIAFNNDLGWTHTVNTIDASDRYELTLKDGGYVFDGKAEQFETREKTIKVRQDDGSVQEERILLKYSLQGPVLAEKGDKAYAVRVAGMNNTGSIEQYHRMATAKNLGEFESALRLLQNPMFNVVYADRSGNILYFFMGNVPVRTEGDYAFWHGTIDGTKSKFIWQKTHPFEDLPLVLNPPSGFLQNCNDAPWLCTYPPMLDRKAYPAYMSPNWIGWRSLRTMHMIRADSSISFARLVDYKLSTELEVADRFLPDLLDAVKEYPGVEVNEAETVLKAWDKKAECKSRGTILFSTWWNMVTPDMYLKRWSEDEPVTTPYGLKEKKKAVELLAEASKKVKEKYGSLDVMYGDIYRFRIGSYDYPANGGPDNLGVFRTMYFAPDKDNKMRAMAGDTYVAVTEFGDKVKASVLLSYGNATQPGNKHVGDQLNMLSEKKLRPALLDRKEVLKNLESREVPGPK